MDANTIGTMILNNWQYVLLIFYVIEKAVKISPSTKDDVLFDMILRPIMNKITSVKK